MPALESITIKGFKSIRGVENLALRNINLIIGANGAGKSNLLSFFSLLRSVRDQKLQPYVARQGGADALLHFGSQTTKTIRGEIAFAGGTRYLVELTRGAEDALVPEDYLKEADGHTVFSFHDRPYPLNSFPLEALTSWRSYHFDDAGFFSPMARAVNIEDNRFLRTDGSNLAAILYRLRTANPASYQQIRASVRRIAPFFDDFRLEPRELNDNDILLEWIHRSSDRYFNAAAFSDGTLRFIALATLLLQPDELKPEIILIDEPELGLHPFAVTFLAALIEKAANRSQIIVATQSSQLIDNFEPEDILVADQLNGATSFSRLDSSRLESWLEDYSLGQLWEKNEIGGRPQAHCLVP